MKLIQIIFILLLSAGCANDEDKSVIRTDIKIVSDKVIEEDKARKIVLNYLTTIKAMRNSTYEVELYGCDQQMISGCKSDPYYSKLFGEYCECNYILYETKEKCYESRRIIETCESGSECKYKFSQSVVGECE